MDEKKNADPTTDSLPKLTLQKERIRVLGVRTGVQTGIPMCPASCFFVTQHIPTITKTG